MLRTPSRSLLRHVVPFSKARLQPAWPIRRALSSTPIARNGSPTKIHNILGGGPAPPVQVRGMTPAGIELHDGLILPSSCIFLDGSVFLWDTPWPLWDAWSKEQFEIFEVVVPKPGEKNNTSDNIRVDSADSLAEILIFGTGKSVLQPPPFIRSYLNSIGIQLDVMNTVSTPKSTMSPSSLSIVRLVERVHDVQSACRRRTTCRGSLVTRHSSEMEDASETMTATSCPRCLSILSMSRPTIPHFHSTTRCIIHCTNGHLMI